MTSDDLDLMGDYAGDDVDIVRTPEGLAAMLPRSAERLDPMQMEMVRDLQRVGFAIRELEERFDALARETRDAGVSWSLIGFCLGLTGEAARLRYGSDA
jgi:hypothetical protein